MGELIPAGGGEAGAGEPVWYAGYGSNLSRSRFLCYLRGGRPPGSARHYPGCLDRTEPADERALAVPGRLHFAGESPVWGGGMAFYDPPGADAEPTGVVLMLAYLLRLSQVLDIVDQEMRRPPGTLARMRLGHPATWPSSVRLGAGRYETLHRLADLDGRAVLTASHGPSGPGVPANPPSARYLAQIIAGLAQAHRLSVPEIVGYLRSAAGIGWPARDLTALVSEVLAGARPDD